MDDPTHIELVKDYQFNELDDYALVPAGTVFAVITWQGINGERCPIVNGRPFVDSIVYFNRSYWKPSLRTKTKTSKEAYREVAYQGVD